MQAEDYIDFMVDAKTVFKVFYLAHVLETKQSLFEDELFNFDTTTDMTVKVSLPVEPHMITLLASEWFLYQYHNLIS